MKKALYFLLLFFAGQTLAQLPAPPRAPLAGLPEAGTQLNQVTVHQAIDLIFRQQLGTDYILSPEIVLDARVVSYNYKGGNNRAFALQFLKTLGYTVEKSGTIDIIKKASPQTVAPEDFEIFIYEPKHKDSSYLLRIIQPLVDGQFTDKKAISSPDPASYTPTSPTSAANLSDTNTDILVYQGTKKSIAMLEKLLPKIDTPNLQANIKAAVYEVTTTKTEGSAIQAIASLLSGKIGLTINKDAATLGNSLTLKFGGFEAVLSALNSDSRLNLITQPKVLVRSGKTSRLTVGQDVPTLGSISYDNDGRSRQSVEYQSSGVILDVTPKIKEDAIDMEVTQELSNFASTETGVSASPTKTKRSIKTSVTMQSGEIIVLGGLTETKKADTKRGLFFLPLGKQAEDSQTDIIILLQAEKV